MAFSNPEQLARAAEQFYEQNLRGELEASHRNEFVAIEPVSGDYFLGRTLSEAVQAARTAHPDRLSYVLRIGRGAAVHLGSGS